MFQVADDTDVSSSAGTRYVSIVIWLAVCTGLAVAIGTVIDEMCLATACSDAASFTFFGIGMGWLGIGYFSVMVLLLWQRHKARLVNLAFCAMVFSGVGAELRLLWIQKYIIGGWCPFCVTICCTLFITATLLCIEQGQGGKGSRAGWLAFAVVMMVTGLAVAVLGVHALT